MTNAEPEKIGSCSITLILRSASRNLPTRPFIRLREWRKITHFAARKESCLSAVIKLSRKETLPLYRIAESDVFIAKLRLSFLSNGSHISNAAQKLTYSALRAPNTTTMLVFYQLIRTASDVRSNRPQLTGNLLDVDSASRASSIYVSSQPDHICLNIGSGRS